MTDGAVRRLVLSGPAHCLRLSGLERSSARADRRIGSGVILGRAPSGQLDADLHEQRGRFRRAVLSPVPARRAVRQADGRQRLGNRNRPVHDQDAGRAARRPRGRPRRGDRDLWRGELVRGVFRARAHGTCAVPHGEHSAPPHAGRYRSGHFDLHDVGDARDAGDPERNTNAVLRHDAICGPRPRHPGLGDHAWLRPLVAEAHRSQGTHGRRRLRRTGAGADRESRERSCDPRARDHRSRVRPGGGDAWPSGRRFAVDRACSASVGRRGSGQSPDVVPDIAAHGPVVSCRRAMGRDVFVGCWRHLVGDRGAHGGRPDRHWHQLPQAARPARDRRCRSQCLGSADFQRRQPCRLRSRGRGPSGLRGGA